MYAPKRSIKINQNLGVTRHRRRTGGRRSMDASRTAGTPDPLR